MADQLHPTISRQKRKSAIEQTSDLLKAYLERWPDPFEAANGTSESENRNADLTAGFLIPQR